MAELDELCMKITDHNKMMSNILDKMEDCLLSREEKITDPESILACRDKLEKSTKEVLNQKRPETENHAWINDQGEMRVKSVTVVQQHSLFALTVRCPSAHLSVCPFVHSKVLFKLLLEVELEVNLEVYLEGEMEGDSKGDFRGDFKRDMEGDLLSSSCQAHVKLVHVTAQI